MSLDLRVPAERNPPAKDLELRPKQTKAWIESLPLSQSVDAGRKILANLSRINRTKVDFDDRLQLLPETEMTLEQAQAVDAAAEIGKPVKLGALDTSLLGRIAAQSARQVLFQRVREAERAVVYRNYVGRIHEMINGIVKRVDRGSIIVELGDTEGVMPRNHQVRHERYSQGDRIRSVVVDVTMDASRPQVVLSRTDPALLEKLLEMEVPELSDGTVVIKKCVREPAERGKVAVFSKDRDVDPRRQVEAAAPLRAFPRVKPGSAVIHLVNWGYQATGDNVPPLKGVRLKLNLAALGCAGASEARLIAPGVTPASLPVRQASVVVPELGLWGVLELRLQ